MKKLATTTADSKQRPRSQQLRRRTPLRANPTKQREWQESSRKRNQLKTRKPLKRGTPLRARNPERLARLEERQFGSDGKKQAVKAMRCLLSGSRGWAGNPVDAAHADRTRGAGGGPECMVPLRRYPEHVDYDSSMSEGRFEEKYGRTRQWVRAQGHAIEAEWPATLQATQDEEEEVGT